MLQKVQKNLREWNMVSPKDKVLVGLSGGADSVCLLMALVELSKEMDFSVEAIHVEHGIRGEESKDDQKFAEELCRQLGILCHVETVDVPSYCKQTGLGLEEGARILRYKEFSQLAKCLGAKVALAHHMEDNAETILFQMVRGSSLTGLCGMQPVRMDENGITYIRPLLSMHRLEIETFLHEKQQAYCVDSTNVELEYSRNYLRNKILPELSKLNTQAVAHMNAAAMQLSDIRDYLEEETNKAWSESVAILEDDEIINLQLKIEKLTSYHKALKKEIVYRAISEISGGKKDITSVHVMDVLNLCENQSGKEVVLPNRVKARKEYGIIHFWKEVESERYTSETLALSDKELAELINSKDELKLSLGSGKEALVLRAFSKKENTDIPKKEYTKWMDYDKIKIGFCIRTRESGDYFIGDANGHRKKLKQYFIDEKIPSAEREKIWILAQENLVLWVIGGRISEHVKVTKDTKTILEITYDGGR